MTNREIVFCALGFLIGVFLGTITLRNNIKTSAELLATENRLLIEWVQKNHGRRTATQLSEATALRAQDIVRDGRQNEHKRNRRKLS